MKILRAYPPNFKAISEVFPVMGRPGILYAWGDKLYNPSGVKLTPWIEAHEQTHMDRQTDAEAWWAEYLIYPTFRLQEEILAHQYEWGMFHSFYTSPTYLEKYLDMMAKRLSSPLYGNLISYEEAKREITS